MGAYGTDQPLVEVTDDHVRQVTDKLKEHPYISEFDMYLFGSKTYKEVSGDIDIFFTKEGELSFDDKVKVKELINETYRVCIQDLHIKADVFYIKDLEVFSQHFSGDTVKFYTTIDCIFEIRNGEIHKFIHFHQRKGQDGLYLFELPKKHKKSLNRGISYIKPKKLI